MKTCLKISFRKFSRKPKNYSKIRKWFLTFRKKIENYSTEHFVETVNPLQPAYLFGQTPRYALFVFRLIIAKLLRTFDDPFLNSNQNFGAASYIYGARQSKVTWIFGRNTHLLSQYPMFCKKERYIENGYRILQVYCDICLKYYTTRPERVLAMKRLMRKIG